MIGAITSFPNIMLIVKSIKPVLFNLEEFSFFVLASQPNTNIKSFYEFCWDSVWYRWLPDPLAQSSTYMSVSFKGLLGTDRGQTPLTLQEKGETLLFL